MKQANEPLRIISVVPSQTELLFDLGLNEEVIGITKFCIHPNEWFRSKQRVGGTKNLNIELIRSLQPNLILANKEENSKEQIELLQQEYQVYVSDISTLDDAYEMISEVGTLAGKTENAEKIIRTIEEKRNENKTDTRPLNVLYLIWREPYMAAGADTFINAMIQEAGWMNVLTAPRYPILTESEIVAFAPEVVLLSSEPYPFKEKHINELISSLPKAKVILVDGELFSWYGSRMSKSFDYFRGLNESILS